MWKLTPSTAMRLPNRLSSPVHASTHCRSAGAAIRRDSCSRLLEGQEHRCRGTDGDERRARPDLDGDGRQAGVDARQAADADDVSANDGTGEAERQVRVGVTDALAPEPEGHRG